MSSESCMCECMNLVFHYLVVSLKKNIWPFSSTTKKAPFVRQRVCKMEHPHWGAMLWLYTMCLRLKGLMTIWAVREVTLAKVANYTSTLHRWTLISFDNLAPLNHWTERPLSQSFPSYTSTSLVWRTSRSYKNAVNHLRNKPLHAVSGIFRQH